MVKEKKIKTKKKSFVYLLYDAQKSFITKKLSFNNHRDKEKIIGESYKVF